MVDLNLLLGGQPTAQNAQNSSLIPNPMSPRPPADDAELSQRKSGWAAFLSGIQQNPKLQQQLLAMSQALLSPGRSSGERLGNALGNFGAIGNQIDQQNFEQDISERRVGAQELSSEAYGRIAAAQVAAQENAVNQAEVNAGLREFDNQTDRMIAITQAKVAAGQIRASEALADLRRAQAKIAELGGTSSSAKERMVQTMYDLIKDAGGVEIPPEQELDIRKSLIEYFQALEDGPQNQASAARMLQTAGELAAVYGNKASPEIQAIIEGLNTDARALMEGAEASFPTVPTAETFDSEPAQTESGESEIPVISAEELVVWRQKNPGRKYRVEGRSGTFTAPGGAR